MKFISTLLLCLFLASAHSQKWSLVNNYSLAVPKGDMAKNIPAAHSFQGGVLYQFGGAMKFLSVGGELGLGAYANKQIEQTFQFSNNVAAVVPVHYSSNVFNANLVTRLSLVSDKHAIIPYVNARAGIYKFYSNVYIDDPENPDGCHALQQENIIKDKTLYWSAGGGVQINTGIFCKSKMLRNVRIDLSANRIRGGTLNYINTKQLMDAQTINDPASKPLNVQFVNASTQDIHEHTVAQVYTSTLQMLEFRLGVTIHLRK